jgi:hypothetical protein
MCTQSNMGAFTYCWYCMLSPPYTRATFWAIKPPREAISSASSSHMQIVFVRIWPLEALRKISIVFDIFHLARKNLNVCGCCELSAELFESISQWQTMVSSCDLEQNGGKCKWFCQLCCCWVVFPTCAVKIHSCLARRLAQQVALVCGGLL